MRGAWFKVNGVTPTYNKAMPLTSEMRGVKQMELRIGDRVWASGCIISEKLKGSDQIETKKVSFEQAAECIFLGWSTIREGKGGIDSNWDDWQNVEFNFPYFHLKKSIKVAKLTRLDLNGNRYYKPISATVDQITKGSNNELNFKPTQKPPPSGNQVLALVKDKGYIPYFIKCMCVGGRLMLGADSANYNMVDITESVVAWSELPPVHDVMEVITKTYN